MHIKITAAAALAAILSMSLAASATEFTAAPMNSGPPVVTIPVVGQIVGVANAVTQPIFQPILAPGGGATAAPMAPAPKRHRRHHVAKRMMHKHKVG